MRERAGRCATGPWRDPTEQHPKPSLVVWLAISCRVSIGESIESHATAHAYGRARKSVAPGDLRQHKTPWRNQISWGPLGALFANPLALDGCAILFFLLPATNIILPE